jgi:hypothetical protein
MWDAMLAFHMLDVIMYRVYTSGLLSHARPVPVPQHLCMLVALHSIHAHLVSMAGAQRTACGIAHLLLLHKSTMHVAMSASKGGLAMACGLVATRQA